MSLNNEIKLNKIIVYIIKKIDENCTVIHNSFQLTNKNVKLCEKNVIDYNQNTIPPILFFVFT